MLRGRPYLLPVLGGCLLVGGLLGVQLGQSAIAGINPIHFQGAAPPPTPAAQILRSPGGAEYLEAYGWPEGRAARAEQCGDCAFSQQAHVFAGAPRVELLAAAPPGSEPEPAEIDPDPAEPRPLDHEVVRYTDYPIEEPREAKPDKPSYQANDVYED